MNKYHAAMAGGSKLERAVDAILELRVKAGEIRDLKRQQTLVLQDGPREKRITWRIDFSFVDCKSEELCFAEAKGFETADYKLKLKMFRGKPQGRLEIWKGTYKSPKLVEVVRSEEREVETDGVR